MDLEKLPEVPRTDKDYNDCFRAFLCAVKNKNEELINLIISKDNMLQRTFSYEKQTLLHVIASQGIVEIASQLIKLGSDVNVRNNNGETPLFFAVKKSTEMVKVLINNGADVKIICKKNTSPLHQALLCGSEEAVQLIINKTLSEIPNSSRQDENVTEDIPKDFSQNFERVLSKENVEEDFSENSEKDLSKNSRNYSIIKKIQNSKKIVELLLNHKTDLNLIKKDYPLLIFFAAKIGNVKIFNSVLNDCKQSICSIAEDRNAEKKKSKVSFYYKQERYATLSPQELNYQGYFGRSALHYAVREQLPEVVRFLINQGADVNSRTHEYYTPLHYAACLENEEIVKILLSFGALVNVKATRRGTPLYFVCGRSEARNLLKPGSGYYYEEYHNTFINRMNPYYEPEPIFNLEIMKLLLKSGADPEIPGETGTTPFLEACRAGNVESVKLLLSFGANLLSLDIEKNSALHHAAVGNSFEVVDLLLKNGLDIEIKNINEYTPLLYATQYEKTSCLEMIEYFVDCGANVNAKNRKGATPLHIASYMDWPNVIECLLELGADVKLKYNQDCNEPVMGYILSSMYVLGLGFGMKVLICFIALKNEELGDYIDFYSRGENRGLKTIHSYFQECKLELNRLKVRRIFQEVRISFYDFLTRDFLNATEIVKNEEIRKVLSSGEYKNEFPCYGFLLEKRFERVKKLEDSVQKTVDFIKEYGDVKLPVFVIVKILSYLCAKDFRIFGRVLSVKASGT